MTGLTEIPCPEIEAYRYGYKEGYEDGRRDRGLRCGYNKCEEYSTQFECSSCGEKCNDTTPWDHPEIKYCPHCGVKIIGAMEYKKLYHSAFPDGKESGE